MKDIEKVYKVRIDFSKSVSEMAEESNFDWKVKDTKNKEFEHNQSGLQDFSLCIVNVEKEMTTEEVNDLLKNKNLRPANIEHLIAFGDVFKDIRLSTILVALGTERKDKHYVYPCLYEENSKKTPDLAYYDPDQRSSMGVEKWDKGYSFLCITDNKDSKDSHHWQEGGLMQQNLVASVYEQGGDDKDIEAIFYEKEFNRIAQMIVSTKLFLKNIYKIKINFNQSYQEFLENTSLYWINDKLREKFNFLDKNIFNQGNSSEHGLVLAVAEISKNIEFEELGSLFRECKVKGADWYHLIALYDFNPTILVDNYIIAYEGQLFLPLEDGYSLIPCLYQHENQAKLDLIKFDRNEISQPWGLKQWQSDFQYLVILNEDLD